MCSGEGPGLEGGLLAEARSRAAEYHYLFREGAGVGERTAQQGGTQGAEPSRLMPCHTIKTIKFSTAQISTKSCYIST